MTEASMWNKEEEGLEDGCPQRKTNSSFQVFYMYTVGPEKRRDQRPVKRIP